MAILEIVSFEGEAMEHEFDRGNGGVLVDVQGGTRNEFTIPAVVGGGGGETSHVF